MLSEDCPERSDDVADQGGTVVGGEAMRNLGASVGVQEAVFLETTLVRGGFEVVGLAEDGVAWFEGRAGVGTDTFYRAGNVVAEDNGEATFNVEAPIANPVVVRIYCRETLSTLKKGFVGSCDLHPTAVTLTSISPSLGLGMGRFPVMMGFPTASTIRAFMVAMILHRSSSDPREIPKRINSIKAT